ncbi:MAG: tetratricopeptide repeat protein [Chloroflexi bacterium]|nr:tetratricopeptide repeat protein [Chloroflexota bacterium]
MFRTMLQDNRHSHAAWQAEYRRQLERRLALSSDYLSKFPAAQVRAHIRSFVTLLNEARRFPDLAEKTLLLISQLHPLPMRWGLGHLWEKELRFALEHISPERADLTAEYRCALGEVYQYRGQFEKAIAEAGGVLSMSGASPELIARAARIMFTCCRANGQLQKADEVIEQVGERLMGDLPAADIPAHVAQAWLEYQQCRLEQMRERGEVDRALELVEDMIWLDRREGMRDLTADLYTHRSTLLWVRSRYPQAVSDLKQAMQIFEEAGDPFNAESLNSNLGLVYWTMGELDLAEKTLLSAIRFYRETGSDQLLTYDTGNLGLIYFARGDLEPALRLTEEHIALADRINFVYEYHRGRRNLGTVLYYFGEYERSIEETTVSHKFYETCGSRDAYALDDLWLALCYHALGEPERALALARKTLEQAGVLKSRVLEQITLRCLAFFLPVEEREPLLLRSLELAKEMERKVEEAAVWLALAEVYTGADRRCAWQTGEEILRAAGAAKWLEGRSPGNPPFLPLLL